MGSLFSKPQPQVIMQAAPVAAPIAPTPVAPLPTIDTDTVKRDRMLNQEKLLTSGGRRSTILTTPQTRGGGDSYSSRTFGS